MQFNILQKAMIDAMKARDKKRKDSIAVLVSAAKNLQLIQAAVKIFLRN